MNFSILLLNNFELFIPEIFFITSIVFLILYSGLIYSNLSILTLYTNKIASFIVFICFILNFNTYLLNHNFEIFQYNFVIILKLIILFSVFCCLIFTENFILQSFEFSFLILLSSLGFILLILSFDLILLYLAIEIQSISFYILSCLKKNSAFSTEASLKYFILGSLASALFLFGCSLIYGITGTINFKDLTTIFINFNDQSLLIIGSLFILSSIFFKLAIAPFHFWSPDVYEGAPTIVTAFFSIVPKLSIFVIYIRFFNNIFYDLPNLISWWVAYGGLCGFLSILVGSIIAIKQTRIKRLLAYSAISHMGYILIGLITGNIEGIQSVFFYLIVYIITNICIWGSILGIKKIKFISELKNLFLINPLLIFTLLISFFSLAGVPPLIGFLSKLFVFISTIESNLYVILLFSVFLSIISTFYYLRLIKIIIFEKSNILNFLESNLIVSYITKFMSFVITCCFFSLFLLFMFPLPLYLTTYYLTLLSF